MDGHEFLRKYHAGEPLTTDDIVDVVECIFDELDRIIEELDREVEEETPHMGAFDTVSNITIPNPDGEKASKAFCKLHGENATAEQEFRAKWKWENHEQIIIKGKFTAADQEIMENASSSLKKAKGKGSKNEIEMRTGSARRKLLECMIVDWTLTDQGRRVEVTPQNIGRLPTNYRKPILEAIDEVAMTMDEDEQEDFLHGAKEPTKES